MSNIIGVPGKIAYEEGRKFDNEIEKYEVNCGCVDYYAYGFRDGIRKLKEKLEAEFTLNNNIEALHILEEAIQELEKTR